MPEREADLCEQFAASARDQGWTVFPEVGTWDLLLVWRNPSVLEGPQESDQVGIEAKLRAGVEVLTQTHRRSRTTGPDFRGVLVPESSPDFRYLASELKLHCFDLKHCGPWRPKAFRKYSSQRPRTPLELSPNLRWDRHRRLWLPPVPLQSSGGLPSPRQLTRWRVAALRICLRLRTQGWLTSEDFKREGIAVSTWKARGWLTAEGKIGKLSRYIAGSAQLPDVGYEAERDAISELTG